MLQNSSTALVPATTDEWSDLAVATLLDCYNDKHIELNRGSIRAKGWQEVITKLNFVCAEGKPVFTYRRCKNKLDVMKRRFKLENDRKTSNGGAPPDWPWFQKMERIMGRNPRYCGIPGGIASGERLTAPSNKFHKGTLESCDGILRNATSF
ncbi:hypothetical protein O6H91_14G055700 [Diphasiastrum complanatum]|uniref:Uncharacterized protein n=1 Tax=Diphasiastrum complanatum TaxID=34168 RepID=A0ACC2BPL7_DIPCM|nr:hypothetical protein O6H91_14G055700 [Diphasiastrum complanatum]